MTPVTGIPESSPAAIRVTDLAGAAGGITITLAEKLRCMACNCESYEFGMTGAETATDAKNAKPRTMMTEPGA